MSHDQTCSLAADTRAPEQIGRIAIHWTHDVHIGKVNVDSPVADYV